MSSYFLPTLVKAGKFSQINKQSDVKLWYVWIYKQIRFFFFTNAVVVTIKDETSKENLWNQCRSYWHPSVSQVFFRCLIIEFFLFTNADVDSNKDTDLDNNIGPICRKLIFWSWHWTDNHKIGTHRFCCKEYLFNFPISKIVNLYLLQKWWNCNKLVMPIELRTVRPSLAIVQLKKANIFL